MSLPVNFALNGVLRTSRQGWNVGIKARLQLLKAAGLGARRFAVRSSGTAEDLEGASFAGHSTRRCSACPSKGCPER